MLKKITHLLITGFVFISSQAYSQSVTPAIINATGGTNFFTFYRFEWSVGEAAAIETMSASNVIVTNGVLQPQTHNPADNNTAAAWGPEELKVLPNPVQNQFEIDFLSTQRGTVTMSLYDNSGKSLETKTLTYVGIGQIERWNISNLPSGAYFLNIQLAPAAGFVSKKSTYKIIKIK
jgi:Secretion system C-terminal sorting domain